jgi:hypothetical protein
MSTVKHQIIVNRSLPEVLSSIGGTNTTENNGFDISTGGFSFEAVKRGTRITVIDEPDSTRVVTVAGMLVKDISAALQTRTILMTTVDP